MNKNLKDLFWFIQKRQEYDSIGEALAGLKLRVWLCCKWWLNPHFSKHP
jgi:hypothetical protein